MKTFWTHDYAIMIYSLLEFDLSPFYCYFYGSHDVANPERWRRIEGQSTLAWLADSPISQLRYILLLPTLEYINILWYINVTFNNPRHYLLDTIKILAYSDVHIFHSTFFHGFSNGLHSLFFFFLVLVINQKKKTK